MCGPIINIYSQHARTVNKDWHSCSRPRPWPPQRGTFLVSPDCEHQLHSVWYLVRGLVQKLITCGSLGPEPGFSFSELSCMFDNLTWIIRGHMFVWLDETKSFHSTKTTLFSDFRLGFCQTSAVMKFCVRLLRWCGESERRTWGFGWFKGELSGYLIQQSLTCSEKLCARR